MPQMDIAQAQNHFSDLIEKALRGEEVVITRDDQPVVKLVAVSPVKPPRSDLFGSDRDLIDISDDFDEPLEGFQGYLE